jgi:hypothetical protein
MAEMLWKRNTQGEQYEEERDRPPHIEGDERLWKWAAQRPKVRIIYGAM